MTAGQHEGVSPLIGWLALMRGPDPPRRRSP